MNTDQLNTSISSLILSLKNVLNNIGNERLSILLNELLPKEKRLNKDSFSEKDLFNLVAMNLETSNIDVLTVHLKLKIDEIKKSSDSLTKEEIDKINPIFNLVCDELCVSNELIHNKINTQITHYGVLCIFSYISRLQLNLSVKKIAFFLNKNERSVYGYISTIENLSDKLPNDIKMKNQINNINQKLKS